jgi:diguanylate cyclase (GGDEF)-like protein
LADRELSQSSFDTDRETSIISLDALWGRAASKNPCIVFLYPDIPLRGKLIKLEKAEYIIGRSPECDLHVDRDSVSRRHARLSHNNFGWVIEDLKSTNGIFVNDSKVKSQFLTDGKTVRIGDTIFKFLAGDNVEAEYYEVSYRLAVSDGLTGAYNRRHFDEFLWHEAALSSRHGHPLSLIMLDIDHFKRVNDKYGHLMGDVVLKKLTHLIRRVSRREDFLARFGGEEFAIILSHIDRAGACETAHKILTLVRNEEFELEPGRPRERITISIGLATRSGGGPIDPAELVREADHNLYQAKGGGRNRIYPDE